jgi:hypothetical protein
MFQYLFQYLSFLYFEKIIDKKMTRKLFKYELVQNYEKFNQYLKPEFEHYKKLYTELKNELQQ